MSARHPPRKALRPPPRKRFGRDGRFGGPLPVDHLGERSQGVLNALARRRREEERRALRGPFQERGLLLQLVYMVVFLGAAWANFSTKDITS